MIWILLFIPVIHANPDNCPHKCICSDEIIDCSNAGINTTEIFLMIDPIKFPLLVTLNMTGNRFDYLEQDLFNFKGLQRHERLEQLDLTNCAIRGIHEDTFVGLPKLEELIVKKNNLSFKGSPNEIPGKQVWPTQNFLKPISRNLKILDLTDAFDRSERQRSSVDFLSNLTQIFNGTELDVLQYLHLSQNDLTTVSADLICHAPVLEYLYLNGNRLHSFTLDQSCAPSLMELHLRSNFIRRPDDAFMQFIDQHRLLQKVYLADNPFTCDCAMHKFIVWARASTKLADKSDYVCARSKPDDYAGRSLISIPEDKLNCSADASEYLHGVYILCAVAFVGLLTLLACVFYANRSILCKRTIRSWLPMGGYQSLGREAEIKAEMV